MDRIRIRLTQDDIDKAYKELRTLSIKDGFGEALLGLVDKWKNKLVSKIKQFFNTLGYALTKAIVEAIKMIGLIPTLEKEPTQTVDSTLIRKLQERYYLIEERSINRLINDIEAGRKTEKQVEAIARQYGNLTKWVRNLKDREAMRKGKREVFAIRLLDPTVKEHCPQCPYYASMGLTYADRLPLPTERCDCRLNCRCQIMFFPSLEVAVKELKKRGIKR
jgi:hypothetical protein